MSTQLHTVEPWIDYGKMTPRSQSIEISMDDYDRARVCVNACAGQPTDLLQAAGIGLLGKSIDKIAVFHAKSMNAEQQRDKLLTAIKLLSGMKLGMVADGIVDKAIAEIEAAK
jgi:hypothetical protein